MKTRSRILWTMCCLLFLNLQLMAQQSEKPKVQVNFDIASGNLIHDTFISEIDSIKSKALTILINGLNKHIGFLEFDKEFDTDAQFSELEIVLDKNPLTSGSNEEYLLNFKMNGSSAQNDPINPTFFTFADVFAFNHSSENLLESFENKLEAYLESSANNDLVNKLFKKIPFVLPDKDHFFIGSSTKAAILPFSKNDLNIDYMASIFNVTMNYEDNGIPITKPNANRTGIGEQDPTSEGHFIKGCILIELDTNINEFLKGEVFIISYIRKIYPPEVVDSDPNDFTNSIID